MAERRHTGSQRVEPGRAAARGVVPPLFPSGSVPARHHTAPLKNEETTPEIEGVYIISVAARLLEMHPQTLRKYEKFGLVRPSRTMGMLRLYSEQDIARLRLIKYLVDDVRMNLAGVEFVLGMANRLLEARNRIAALQAEQRLKEIVGQEFQRLLEMLDMAGDDSVEG